MMKTEKQTSDRIWLVLNGYRVASLKPEFREAAMELEREINEGVFATADPVRPDFYDVALKGGSAYIHVHRDGGAVYLIAYFGIHMVDCSFSYGVRRKAERNDLFPATHGCDSQDLLTLPHAAQPLA